LVFLVKEEIIMEENEYILLILKHLSKEASPAEQAGLEKWLNADPEHRREYQAIEEIWEESGQAVNNLQFDKEAAWKKVGERLAPEERPVQENRQRSDGFPGKKRWQLRLFSCSWADRAGGMPPVRRRDPPA
jgi:anti-sigma factor RsiW